MTQTFTIHGRLPGANEYIGALSHNRFVGGKMKKDATNFCAQYAMRIRPITEPSAISIRWIEKDCRRDLDNVAFAVKFILDGLVLAGKLPNDTRQWVTAITHSFSLPDKKNPRIEVDLTS